MSTHKTFTLGAVLSVTDGHLACPVGDAYEILNWITGDNLTTIGLLSAAEPCKAELLRQYPQLTGIAMPDEVAEGGEPLIRQWLDGLSATFGATLEVAPLPAGSWNRRDVMDDVADILVRGGNPIVVDPRGLLG